MGKCLRGRYSGSDCRIVISREKTYCYCNFEKNLYNDPDFVKSYEDSKKKAAAKGETFVPMKDREIVALIAYLQRLGTDIKVKKAE